MVTVALDEHIGMWDLVDALAGFDIQAVRIVDVLGQGHEDPALLAWSSLSGIPLVTADVRIVRHIGAGGHRKHASVIVIDREALGVPVREMAPFIALAALDDKADGVRDWLAVVTRDGRGDTTVLWGL